MALLLLGCLTSSDLVAQPHPAFLRIKGIATGSDVVETANDVQLAGNFAYVVHAGGMEIYCITNPSAPFLVAGYKSQSPVNAAQLSGHYAYLALGAALTLTNDSGALDIVDVADPSHPVLVGHTNTLARAASIRIAGDYAYVAETTRWTGSNLLGSLEIYDIRAPAHPILVSSFDTPGSATSLDVGGTYVYFSDGVLDVQVLDVSDPRNPRRVGLYISDVSRNGCGFEPGGPANYVQVIGHQAISSGDNGLILLDITDPSQPIPIGDNFCFPIYTLHIAGHHAYASVYHSSLSTFFLYILDASDPANLMVVGLKEDWQPARMQVSGNLIYVATLPLVIYEFTARPALQAILNRNGNLVLAWEFAPGFVLQRTSSLADPVWSDLPDSADQTSMELPLSDGNEFFRLFRAVPEP
jgi:hypothetical protein